MKRNSKILSTLVVALMLAITLALVGCGQEGSDEAESGNINYTMVVDATEAGEGILLEVVASMPESSNIYQILAETGLSIESKSSSGGVYVYGIDDVIADDGKAGWLFFVNGEMPSVSADQLEVADGDVIEWKYFADASQAM